MDESKQERKRILREEFKDLFDDVRVTESYKLLEELQLDKNDNSKNFEILKEKIQNKDQLKRALELLKPKFEKLSLNLKNEKEKNRQLNLKM